MGAVLFALAGHAEDPAAAARAVKDADRSWLAAAAAKDVDRTVSFWTDDAVIQPPGQPAVVGKEAIRQYVSGAFAMPGFSIRWQSGEPVISKGGDMAYSLATNEVSFQDPQGKPVTARGRGVVVWRRGPDGSWKCAVDTWNAGPEDAGPRPKGGSMAKVLGVGGVFFKSPNPKTLNEWYARSLGMDFGSQPFTRFPPEMMPKGGTTVWSAFADTTDYFAPSEQRFMINLVVDDLDAALKQVAAGGAKLVGEVERYPYGNFGWFIDPDGNKVELWEPKVVEGK